MFLVTDGSVSDLAQHICLNGRLPFLSGSFLPWPSLSFRISSTLSLLVPFPSPYLSRQPGPYLSAWCLVPSCASWPLAIPQSPSCQLRYPLSRSSPPLSFCMLSKLSTSVSNALSSGARPDTSVSLSSAALYPFVLPPVSDFSIFGSTFSFNHSACLTLLLDGPPSLLSLCFSPVYFEFLHVSAYYHSCTCEII